MIESSKSTFGDVGKSMMEIKNMGKVLREMTSVKRLSFARYDTPKNDILDKNNWKARRLEL